MEYSLKEGARIDFRRGLPQDDFVNTKWARWFQRLMSFRAKIYKCFGNYISSESKGNAVEIISGISYAASRNGQNLKPGENLNFSCEDAKLATASERTWWP
jgi:hypothetical protein